MEREASLSDVQTTSHRAGHTVLHIVAMAKRFGPLKTRLINTAGATLRSSGSGNRIVG